jgi:hypothetical protein
MAMYFALRRIYKSLKTLSLLEKSIIWQKKQDKYVNATDTLANSFIQFSQIQLHYTK